MKNKIEHDRATAMKAGVVGVGAERRRCGALLGSAERSIKRQVCGKGKAMRGKYAHHMLGRL